LRAGIALCFLACACAQIKVVLCAKPAAGSEPALKVEAATDGVLPVEVAAAIQVVATQGLPFRLQSAIQSIADELNLFLCCRLASSLGCRTHTHASLVDWCKSPQEAVLARWAKERRRASKAALKAASAEAPAPPYCFALVEVRESGGGRGGG
jgi:hypothetical protein